MLPTPEAKLSDSGPDYARANRAGSGGDDDLKSRHGNGNGHGASLAIEAARLLPTPSVSDGTGGHLSRSGDRRDELLLPGVAKELARRQWGDYADAIARWEAVIGRPAPDPTETGPKGSPRLSPRFVEWMMGLPDGHVTGAGLSRVAELKALGNGVVPQQAETAIRYLLTLVDQEVAA